MQNYKFLPYNKTLVSLARELRNNQTPAEIKFWLEILKDKRLASYKFSSQKPIDNFIMDFYCSSLRLVVEIDGKIHKAQKERDNERDEILKQKFGLKILRYKNEEVLEKPVFVIEDLIKYINTTPPSLPLSGEETPKSL